MPYFYIAVLAWIGGVVVSFVNGNRKLPSVVLVLGLGLIVAIFTGHAGLLGVSGLAILAAIVWIANKADTA